MQIAPPTAYAAASSRFQALANSRNSHCDSHDPELLAFFVALGWEGGRVEVIAGTNRTENSDKIDLITYNKATGRPTTRQWIAPDDHAALVRHIRRQAERWGNVYVSVGTYDPLPSPYKPGTFCYTRNAPRSRRCIVLDDVQDLAALRLPPTWVTETSPGNYQVGYVSDELFSPAVAVRLAEGAALIERTDSTAADAEQLIRVPNTLNTKAKCAGRAGNPKQRIEPEGWRVRLRVADGPRYSVAQMAAAWLPGGLAALSSATREQPERGDRQRVEINSADWCDLPNGAALMGTARYQRLFAARSQLAALQRGERVMLHTKGGPRDTDSEQVAVLVQNLLTTGRKDSLGASVKGLGAPPEAEIRALALHWYTTLRPDCQLDVYQMDVDRLILKYRPAGYAPEPTRLLDQSAARPLPRLSASTQRGRPAGQRVAQADKLAALLDALPVEADGMRRTTRGRLAAALGTTERMVTEYLADLRAADRLETRTEARALAVLRVEINPAASVPREGGNPSLLHGSTMRQTATSAEDEYTPAPLAPSSVVAQPAPRGGGVSSSDEQPDESAIEASDTPAPEPESEPASVADAPAPISTTFDLGDWLRRCATAPVPPLPPVKPPEGVSTVPAVPIAQEVRRLPQETPAEWADRMRRREQRHGLRVAEYVKRMSHITEGVPRDAPPPAQQPMRLPDPKLAELLALLESRGPLVAEPPQARQQQLVLYSV